MSSKLDLQAKVLLASIEGSQDKEQTLKDGMKAFAVEVLNTSQHLRDKKVDVRTARDLVLALGVNQNLKTKKYF